MKVKKPFYKRFLPAAVAVFAVAGVVGCSDSGDSSAPKEAETATGETVEEEIVYEPVTADQLVSDLETNALKASKTWKDKYIEVTGNLGNIDSGGSYINLDSSDEWNFTNIQCFLKNEEQQDLIMEMQSGQPVTVKGKVKDVGEFLGYSIDVDEIQ